MVLTFLAVMALILHLAMAAILIHRYTRTRDVGFIWLGAAVVIWPLVSKVLDVGERIMIDRTLNRSGTTFYPFTLVERGELTIGGLAASLALFEQLIGVVLLVIAVLFLSKDRHSSNFRPAA